MILVLIFPYRTVVQLQPHQGLFYFAHIVKPVLSGHLKLVKTNVLMENGSLMKDESIAECFQPALSYHLSLRPLFFSIFEWPLKTSFTEQSRGLDEG